VDNPRTGSAQSDVQKHGNERFKSAQVSLLCKVVGGEVVNARIDKNRGWQVLLYWEKSTDRHDEGVEY